MADVEDKENVGVLNRAANPSTPIRKPVTGAVGKKRVREALTPLVNRKAEDLRLSPTASKDKRARGNDVVSLPPQSSSSPQSLMRDYSNVGEMEMANNSSELKKSKKSKKSKKDKKKNKNKKKKKTNEPCDDHDDQTTTATTASQHPLPSSATQPASENRFAYLLKPIRDLADNWNVDIAGELEGYLHELDSIAVVFGGGPRGTCELLEGDRPETQGGHLLSFPEAALLIQGSAMVYSRKVEYLHGLVYRTLGMILDRRRRRMATAVAAVKSGKTSSLTEDGGDTDLVWFGDAPDFLSLDATLVEDPRAGLMKESDSGPSLSGSSGGVSAGDPLAVLTLGGRGGYRATLGVENAAMRRTPLELLALGMDGGRGKSHRMSQALVHASSGALLLDSSAMGSLNGELAVHEQQGGISHGTTTTTTAANGADVNMSDVNGSGDFLPPDLGLDFPDLTNMDDVAGSSGTYDAQPSSGSREEFKLPDASVLRTMPRMGIAAAALRSAMSGGFGGGSGGSGTGDDDVWAPVNPHDDKVGPAPRPWRRGRTYRPPSMLPPVDRASLVVSLPTSGKGRGSHAAGSLDGKPVPELPGSCVLSSKEYAYAYWPGVRARAAEAREERGVGGGAEASARSAMAILRTLVPEGSAVLTRVAAGDMMAATQAAVIGSGSGKDGEVEGTDGHNDGNISAVAGGFDGIDFELPPELGLDAWSGDGDGGLPVPGGFESYGDGLTQGDGGELASREGSRGVNGWRGDDATMEALKEAAATTYEDLVRGHVAKYMAAAEAHAAETDLTRRVAEWTDRIVPVLEDEERHEVFDIDVTCAEVVDMVPESGDPIAFSDLVAGESTWKIARMFVASLNMVNAGKLSIEDGGDSAAPFTLSLID